MVGAGRSPKAGATVWLLPPVPPHQTFHSWPLPLRRVSADAQGEFSFDNVAPGTYQVWANQGKQTSRSERLRGSAVTVTEGGASPKAIELQLRDGIALKLRVVTAQTQEPISGAVVVPQFSDLGDDFRTDEAGEVTVEPLTPAVWTIDVWADCYTRQSRHVNLHNGHDAVLEMRMVPAGLVEGTVRDEQNRPIAKARVGASQGMQGAGNQRTTDDGSYHVRSVPRSGEVEVYVFAAGYQMQRRTLQMSAGKGQCDFTLAPYPSAGSIKGVVTGPDGAPVPGARIVNRPPIDDEVSEATAGPDGRFHMDKLYQGFNDVAVVVHAGGFAPQRVTVKPGPADAPGEVKIELRSGHRISGRVVDEDGRPLDDVRISYAGGNSPFGVGGSITTGANGRFKLDFLPADCPFSFAKDHYSDLSERRLTLDAEGEVTVVMSPSGIVRGRAINAATGEPIHALTVRATFTPQRTPSEPTGGIRSSLVNPGEFVPTQDGSFEVRDLLLGMPLQLIVEAEGFQRQIVPRVKAQSPDQAAAVEIKLSPEDPDDFVAYRGRVLDDDGQPAADVELRLLAASPPDSPAPAGPTRPRITWQMVRQGRLASDASLLRFAQAVSDEAGQFGFSRIPRGAVVELVWWSNGWAPGRRQNLEQLSEQDRDQLTLTLQPGARITGRIDRQRYPNVELVGYSEPSGFFFNSMRLTTDQETFEFSDLPPGEYRVNLHELGPPASAQGGVRRFGRTRSVAIKKVTLEPGARQQVDFGASDDP